MGRKKKSRNKSEPTPSQEVSAQGEISKLVISKYDREYEQGRITEKRYKEILKELKKPVLPKSEEDEIVNSCRLWVNEYKRLECKVPRKDFNNMLSTMENHVSSTSPLMSGMHLTLVELVDDIVTITQAFILKEEGKLVGCTPVGLLEAVEKLQRLVIPKVRTGGFRQGASGQCLICMKQLGKGAVVRYTDCGRTCHSQCILQWLAENTSCPYFCGSELRGLANS